MEKDKNKFAPSSMVNLKAELYRKQEEFKKQKTTSLGFLKGKKSDKPKDAKRDIWSRQNAGVSSRAQRDLEDKTEVDSEEDEMLAKSSRSLERKAKLYNKILTSSEIPEEDGSEYYLVDFQKKAIDTIVADRGAEREKEEKEAERRALGEKIPEPSCPDEEWVDFTDCLGRERRCMRKDLKDLMKKDKDLALAQKSRDSDNSTTDGDKAKAKKVDPKSDGLPHLMSTDMHREMMRQKWEDETRELMEKGQDQIHYSNVQYDEIRTHGVGFYQFSKDHSKREEELESLKGIREKTKDERTRKDKIKDKRNAMMEARLAKVRQRRNLQAPDVKGAGKESVKAESQEDSETIGPKLCKSVTSVSTSEEESTKLKLASEQEAEERRKTHIREWDKHKAKPEHWTAKNYVEYRRQEREDEFAPPTAYFDEKIKKKMTAVSDDARLRRLQAFTKCSRILECAPPASYRKFDKEVINKQNVSYDKKKGLNQVENKESTSSPQIPANIDLGNIPLPTQDVPTSRAHDQSKSLLNTSEYTKQATENLDLYSQTTLTTQSTDFQNSGWNHNISWHQNHYYQQPSNIYPHANYPSPDVDFTHHNQPTEYPPNTNVSIQQHLYTQHYQQQMGQTQWNKPGVTPNFQPFDQVYSTNSTCIKSEDVRPQMNQSQEQPNYNGSQNYQYSSQPGTRKVTAQEKESELPERKPKVPKLSIVDTRFMSTETVSALKTVPEPPVGIAAIPYKPGSFSAGKYITAVVQDQKEASSLSTHSDTNAHISQIPVLYSKEQRVQQEVEIANEKKEKAVETAESEKDEEERKVRDFLASIK